MTKSELFFDTILSKMPIVAILRGVKPSDVSEIGKLLIEAGVCAIEIPTNSPDPFKSLENLVKAIGDRAICGSGTVLTESHVDQCHDAGGQIVVSPNTDPVVIKRTIEKGMISIPGFSSATEAFVAIKAGARYLKLFPADSYTPSHLKSLKTVLPKEIKILAVGGIDHQNMQDWIKAGAYGFGIGSAIYKDNDLLESVKTKIENFKNSIKL